MTDSSAPAASAAGTNERRWPIVIVLVSAAFLITSLPSRYQVAPSWVPWALCAAVTAPMIVVTVAPGNIRWHRIERRVVFAFAVLAILVLLLMLDRLVRDMFGTKHGYDSLTLLESAVTIWTLNVLAFALFYWQLDGRGPEARASAERGVADYHFGEYSDTEREPGTPPWTPHFVDYLFLAFATSTSFTPPDYARPNSSRAKVLAMMQASISLCTLVLIASRAVATLS